MIVNRGQSAVLLVTTTNERMQALGDVARECGWCFLPHATPRRLRGELDSDSTRCLLFWLSPNCRAPEMLGLISFVRSRWPGAFPIAASDAADPQLERGARAVGANVFVQVAPDRPLGPQLEAAVERAAGTNRPPPAKVGPVGRAPPERSHARGRARDRPYHTGSS